MPRFRCLCAYDGTDFNGWQSQVGGNTVQDFLERRLEVIFKEPVRIHASGRTDAGVHALGQVFHFDAEWSHGAPTLARALRSGIPSAIQVNAVRQAKAEFHSRFSAQGKRYRYTLHTDRADPLKMRYTWSIGRALNVEAMREAAAILEGTHDFSAYSAKRNDGKDEMLDPVRNLRRLEVKGRGQHLSVIAEANGFLYKMVRALVGTLVSCGVGRMDKNGVLELLNNPKIENRPYETAPAQGLCLEKVFY